MGSTLEDEGMKAAGLLRVQGLGPKPWSIGFRTSRVSDLQSRACGHRRIDINPRPRIALRVQWSLDPEGHIVGSNPIRRLQRPGLCSRGLSA